MGAVFTFLLVKTGPTLKHKKVVGRLKADKTNLEADNLSLEERNTDLAKIIAQLQKDNKELKESDEVLSNQVILCLELLGGITSIRQNGDLTEIRNAKIIVTERWSKKWEKSLHLDKDLDKKDLFISD